MNKLTNFLLLVVIALLLLNVWLTAAGVSKLQQLDKPADNTALPVATAREWGDRVIALYNRQDHEALHALFSGRARVKISQQQLDKQLEKLHKYFGEVEDSAYSTSVRVGVQGGVEYYQLFFNLRVSGSAGPATMTVSLASQGGRESLYGMRINGAAFLD